ncbi:PAS domain-containing protein [Jannaschia sp. CCS1]|uniref:PAS domain-containing protein n=1 Tax=Jannaschia sp. (strain CCS1) TaxID=290400 RepID=UPI000053A9D4|nr:PAS domain-containing protein [Jannaschia sp. CCS1]ABD55995.1 putative PAS/PAC sensor protein [Jannaschia sp. CCS1]
MIESSLLERGISPSGAAPTQTEVEVLAGILAASTDACWCMEFGEPVDLTAPEHEIVRQVFENDPRWRFSNAAMSRLYLLDSGEDLEARPTSEIFPRNDQNEEFILALIANGFEIDAAPALDTRYDGVEIYVENDVRAHVVNGKLLRMFGIVRDVGKQRHREERVLADLEQARTILAALPQLIIACNDAGRITAVNPAAERHLAQSAAEVLGLEMGAVNLHAAINDAVSKVIDRGLPSNVTVDGQIWKIVPNADGGAVVTACDVTMGGAT